jgi:hypothetical protein
MINRVPLLLLRLNEIQKGTKKRKKERKNTKRRRLFFVSAPVILIFITQWARRWGELVKIFLFSPFYPSKKKKRKSILMCSFLFLLLRRLLSSLLHWVVAFFLSFFENSLSKFSSLTFFLFQRKIFSPANKHNVNVIQKGIVWLHSYIKDKVFFEFFVWQLCPLFLFLVFYVCIMHAMIFIP